MNASWTHSGKRNVEKLGKVIGNAHSSAILFFTPIQKDALIDYLYQVSRATLLSHAGNLRNLFSNGLLRYKI
ncbi:MAG: hypothetical protein RLZZ66_2155 [Pseudomonadota bacterium]|jgi:hypothetical protein